MLNVRFADLSLTFWSNSDVKRHSLGLKQWSTNCVGLFFGYGGKMMPLLIAMMVRVLNWLYTRSGDRTSRVTT